MICIWMYMIYINEMKGKNQKNKNKRKLKITWLSQHMQKTVWQNSFIYDKTYQRGCPKMAEE